MCSDKPDRLAAPPEAARGVDYPQPVTFAVDAAVLATGKGGTVAIIGGIVIIVLGRAAYVLSQAASEDKPCADVDTCQPLGATSANISAEEG